MNVLVIGGTRFIGKHLVGELLKKGHEVTIATRGIAKESFGNSVKRITINRLSESSLKENFANICFDVVYDSLAYCSNDIKILLDNISCHRYIITSTTAVYDKHINTIEEDFIPSTKELIWCNRTDFPYDEIKRQAECALFQKYSHINFVAVRFPYVIGKDDYTKRLHFYVDHILNQKPMNINNFDKQMAFICSEEAGKFLAYFVDNDYVGAINGASSGTISIKDISDYIESKTGNKAILGPHAEEAPYNGETEYSINTDKASTLGFCFSSLKLWIYNLIDIYIQEITVQKTSSTETQ